MEAARPATHEDVPRLAELNRLAVKDLAAFRGGGIYAAREARAEPIEDGFAAAIDDDDQCVVVGTIDDVPIGYAAAHVETLRDGSRLGVVSDIFVESEARAIGVGEAMMNALLAWLRERGCSGVDALALPGDRTTKNFFEESGFTARLLVMHHRMGES